MSLVFDRGASGSGAPRGGKGRVLVTGSAGLVGRALVDALARTGRGAVPFDLRDDPADDVRDAGRLAAAMRGCEGVVHLAAVSRVAWGEADPDGCASVNVEGTASVLQAALSLPSPPWVVFASSREVYGHPSALPVREDAPLAPVNAYGASKRRGEALVEAAGARGLRTAVVRLSNVYGTEHDHPDRAVPSLLWRAMEGHDLVLTGADVFFDFVHVADCVRGLLQAAEAVAAEGRPLPPLHLVTGRRTSLGDLARLAIAVTGSRSPVVARPPRSFDVAGFCGDPARAAALIGFRAEVGLEDGLGRLAALLAARGRAPDPVAAPRSLASPRPAGRVAMRGRAAPGG